eukprot:scaffold6151_cov82-Skeletonema_dohrnii-CCMP3373.AAC.1
MESHATLAIMLMKNSWCRLCSCGVQTIAIERAVLSSWTLAKEMEERYRRALAYVMMSDQDREKVIRQWRETRQAA